MTTVKADYINPFLMASVKVIKDACRLDITLGKPGLKSTEFKDDELLILMGVTGEMRGQVILAFPNDGALKIASAMCMMQLPELNELAQSAVSELCNMILGNTATLFSVNGIAIDITPPTVCTGNVTFSSSYAANICIPMFCDGVKLFEINVAIKGD